MSTYIPKPYYVAFIDEAGDPGLKTVRPVDAKGATEWLCLSAVLTSARHEASLAEWVQSALAKGGARNRSELHYRDLADHQKRIVVSELAQVPIRGFVLASNKKNMRGYRNERAEQVRSAVEDIDHSRTKTKSPGSCDRKVWRKQPWCRYR